MNYGQRHVGMNGGRTRTACGAISNSASVKRRDPRVKEYCEGLQQIPWALPDQMMMIRPGRARFDKRVAERRVQKEPWRMTRGEPVWDVGMRREPHAHHTKRKTAGMKSSREHRPRAVLRKGSTSQRYRYRDWQALDSAARTCRRWRENRFLSNAVQGRSVWWFHSKGRNLPGGLTGHWPTKVVSIAEEMARSAQAWSGTDLSKSRTRRPTTSKRIGPP